MDRMKSIDKSSHGRPEHELLLCCARTHIENERGERIKSLLKKDMDWAYLLQKSLQHNLAPLLYKNLNALSPGQIPEPVLGQFKKIFLLNVRRTLFLTKELFAVVNFLDSNGISAIPYKGPPLTASVYGDLALRPFRDLDIMIRQQEVLRARDLLVSLGYQPQVQLNGIQAAAYVRTKYELPLIRNPGRMIVELKWGIVDQYFSFPMESGCLRERLKPIRIDGKAILTFSHEDTLLILCVHGTKHLWQNLIMVCDVSEMIKGCRGLDWDWVLREAGRLGGRRMLFLGLFLAKHLLGATLPGAIDRKIEDDPRVERLAGQVEKRLFGEPEGPPNLLKSVLFHLEAKERTKDRIRYGYHFTMTTTVGDWAFRPLPNALFPLYHLVRPVRLTVKYGDRLFKHFVIKCLGRLRIKIQRACKSLALLR